MNRCAPGTMNSTLMEKTSGDIVIALAGQPNMGKSTIFNALTGLNQHVGNWPGKTVERRDGQFTYQQRNFTLVDLPGTYSLTSNSPEEVITREYILQAQPDLVIAVVNAANLERSLYLLAELVTLPTRLIVALNMMDVAAQENIHVDPEGLEKVLHIPVVPMIATHVTSIKDLMNRTLEMLDSSPHYTPNQPLLPARTQQTIRELAELIEPFRPPQYPVGWVETKLLEGDTELSEQVRAATPDAEWQKIQLFLHRHETELMTIISNRYEWISQVIRTCVLYKKTGVIGLTERLDRIAAHPVWGLFTLAAILGLVFWLTFSIGAPVQGWMEDYLIAPLTQFADQLLATAAPWVRGLVSDGVIGGVGSVLTFLPILAIFFAVFGLLEDIGYMARAAYVMDNLMHLMGLHGKSFLPLFLGFGCNVPSILGARVIDTREARLLTILVAPLVPCAARMAVVAFITPAFFGNNAALVSWGLVFGSMMILVLLGVILNRTIFAGKKSAFIMEMPLYHLPNLRTIGILVWQRSLSFIKKAGTVMLAVCILIWILSYLPGGDVQTSYLASAGKAIEPIGKWIGLDWKLTLALLTSFLAKENAIATLGVLFGGAGETGLAATLAGTYSTATALSFLTVSILFIPCAATVAVIKQETNSWKWTFANIGLLLFVSVFFGFVVFHLTTWIGG